MKPDHGAFRVCRLQLSKRLEPRLDKLRFPLRIELRVGLQTNQRRRDQSSRAALARGVQLDQIGHRCRCLIEGLVREWFFGSTHDAMVGRGGVRDDADAAQRHVAANAVVARRCGRARGVRRCATGLGVTGEARGVEVRRSFFPGRLDMRIVTADTA